MNRQTRRLPAGGSIDRTQPLQFTFNGRALAGFKGDTLASALLANGVETVARSFRFHRRRGILSAGPEEAHAIVSIGSGRSTLPNVRATCQPLFEGLEAKSQNGWPGVEFDLAALVGRGTRFLPVGFYYKTFMWPSWNAYEAAIRRFTGSAPAPVGRDPEIYDKRNLHCDVLVIGGGPAGLATALSASESGARVVLADEQQELGGGLNWRRSTIDGRDGAEWARDAAMLLSRRENVSILTSTTVAAAWGDGYYVAVERTPRSMNIAQRLWKIRCAQAVLATGAAERPMVFPDNDLPGVMLADAARRYINQYAVSPGARAVIFTNNDSAYAAALEAHENGITVEAIIDTRRKSGALAKEIEATGARVLLGYEIVATHGRKRVAGVSVRSIAQPGARATRIHCDLLLMSGGWSPIIHLSSQQGGKVRYDETLACMAPAGAPSRMSIVGAANAEFDLKASLQSGCAIGQKCSGPNAPAEFHAPRAVRSDAPYQIEPYWGLKPSSSGRQWVDFYHDVTANSIELAAREGYASVEHLKRYTTTGMAPDQGKTSNINALGILAESTKRPMAQAGVTTFRPPYTPVRIGALAGRETGSRAWPMRRSPLHDWHVEASGVMEDHSGWLRPAFYPRDGESEEEAIRREVLAARGAVALFDGSSLGKIEVKGPDAARFLNRMYVNNVMTLKPGRVRYGIMLNENGIIMDDGVFARLADDHFIVSASSAGAARVYLGFEEWLQTEWPDLDVVVHNATTQWATITISGPASRDVIGALLTELQLSGDAFPHMSVVEGALHGAPFRLMRVSFTGELSFELNVPAGHAENAWRSLLAAGAAHGVTPIGLEALDILRLEKGYLEVGVDTDVSTSPFDVGWRGAISKKQADFIGKRSLTRADNLRPDRLQLVGVMPVSPDERIPVGAHFVSQASGAAEGHVTSACISPTLGRSIAMGLLAAGESRMGENVTIDVDGRQVSARVCPACFFDPENTRLNA